MNALILDREPRYVTDWPEPRPQAGEAVVRIDLAGVCGTDLELCEGYKGGFRGVLGHEFVGTVKDSPQPALLGRRVAASINVGCGNCPYCRERGPEHCPTRQVLGILGRDGCFAERMAVPCRNLVPVPDQVGDQEAVFAEPLAAALHVRDVLPSGRTVAVVGPGRLGLLVAQVLAERCRLLVVLGRRPESLTPASALGLATGLSADAETSSFDVTVEASGSATGFDTAVRITRPLGAIVLKSTWHGRPEVDLSQVVVKELELAGSRCGSVPDAMAWLRQGRVRLAPLIEATYPLADGCAALAHAARPGALKVLLALGDAEV